MKKILTILLLLICATTVFAGTWKDETPRDKNGDPILYPKGSIIETESIQLRITEINAENEEAKVTIMDGKGNILTTNKVVSKGETLYISGNLVRAKLVDFHSRKLSSGSFTHEVAFEIEIQVEANILKLTVPEEMEVGVLYSAEIEMENTGQEAETFSLTYDVPEPYLEVKNKVKDFILNPIAANQKVTFTIDPLEAVEDGKFTVNVVHDGEILTSEEVTGIKIIDNSDGYIESVDLPTSLVKGKKYTGKIRFTNNAGSAARMQVYFIGESFDIGTRSKSGRNTLAELVSPHTAKSMDFPITPIKTGEQVLQIELYSNDRLVDKVLYDVSVAGYVSPEEVEEVKAEATPLEEEETEAVEEAAVEEETPESLAPVTGNIIKDEPVEAKSSAMRFIGVVIAVLLSFLVYTKLVKTEEPGQKKKKR